ncbi:lysophospholipase [Belliella sp. R4-6]|uniref:Lysophospholipase n=1 Tax=Belliella alkalica TaxID=1730871 RepID=A0ABS9V835_9BACT|nr:alpha/beta hydrolase [Belliella alkalica]MCH7412578.1 lysophospholipase [Belliella alkalica]
MNHLETTYTTHDNIKLFLQAWMPETPRAALLLVHGLGEHSSRYQYFAEILVASGIAVFTFDGRGHGKSSKPKPTAYFSSHEDYLKDIDALLGKVKTFCADVPLFIFGHSIGGGLVAKYCIDYQPDLAGVILSSAALRPSDNISKFLIKVSSFVSFLTPKLKTFKLDSSTISHDLEEVRKYNEDPLVYSDAIPARTGHELLRMMKGIKSNMLRFKNPVLLIHGTADQLTDPIGSEEFFRKVTVEDKTYTRYEGLYHELINEYEKDKVIEDIRNWIDSRITKI